MGSEAHMKENQKNPMQELAEEYVFQVRNQAAWLYIQYAGMCTLFGVKEDGPCLLGWDRWYVSPPRLGENQGSQCQ